MRVDDVASNICQALHCGGQGFPYLSNLRGSLGGRCVRGVAGTSEVELPALLSPGAAIACDLTQALSLEHDCVDTNALERFLPTSFDEILRSDTSLLGRVMPPQLPPLPQHSPPPPPSSASASASPPSSFGLDGSAAATVVVPPPVRTSGVTSPASSTAAAGVIGDCDSSSPRPTPPWSPWLEVAAAAAELAHKAAYLASAPVSSPLILLSQMVHLGEFLDESLSVQHFAAAAGHSQGAAAAIAAASCDFADPLSVAHAARRYARCLMWSGLRAQAATAHAIALQEPALLLSLGSGAIESGVGGGGKEFPPMCMLAVSGVTLSSLVELIAKVNAGLPAGARLGVTLQNAEDAFVVGGTPLGLWALRHSPAAAATGCRVQGVAATVPFHSAAYLGDTLGVIIEDLRERKLVGDINQGGAAGSGPAPSPARRAGFPAGPARSCLPRHHPQIFDPRFLSLLVSYNVASIMPGCRVLMPPSRILMNDVSRRGPGFRWCRPWTAATWWAARTGHRPWSPSCGWSHASRCHGRRASRSPPQPLRPSPPHLVAVVRGWEARTSAAARV